MTPPFTEREQGEVAACLAMIEDLVSRIRMVVDSPEDPEGCPHPKASVVDMTTFGGDPKYRCTSCGAESATPFSTFED